MDHPFDGWRTSWRCVTLRRYAAENALVIGLEIALVALTLVLFALFDLFIRGCERI